MNIEPIALLTHTCALRSLHSYNDVYILHIKPCSRKQFYLMNVVLQHETKAWFMNADTMACRCVTAVHQISDVVLLLQRGVHG